MFSKQTVLLAQLFIAGFMAAFMTGFFGFLHLGANAAWLQEWGRSFVIAWPVAFLASMVAGPLGFRMAALVLRRKIQAPPAAAQKLSP